MGDRALTTNGHSVPQTPKDAAPPEPGQTDGSKRSRLWQAAAGFVQGVRGDFELMRQGRAKYLGDELPPTALPTQLVKSIGLQMMFSIRCMHLLRDAGMGVGAQIASRMIRYVYGAEIHWQSTWAPGVNIVHGNGLVVGSNARVGPGCVLLHNVTLGDAFDRASGKIGGPTLERNVHIGPGCTLLGPITVGADSKLMAGTTLDTSVPPRSLVLPPPATVKSRSGRGE